MSWLDWPCLIDWLTEWKNPIYHICRCMLNILYLIGSDFMSYYTRIKISHGCRFHEISHQNQNISWLQISWDITPEAKYFMVTNFMIYYTRIKISHGCRFHEIFDQNQNISWLQISWDITPESKYLMVAHFLRYFTRIKISHGYKFYEI